MDLKENLKKICGSTVEARANSKLCKKDNSSYPWIIGSLNSRICQSGIYYSDRDATVDDVRQAVAEELDGPGKCLGYSAIGYNCMTRCGRNLHILERTSRWKETETQTFDTNRGSRLYFDCQKKHYPIYETNRNTSL